MSSDTKKEQSNETTECPNCGVEVSIWIDKCPSCGKCLTCEV